MPKALLSVFDKTGLVEFAQGLSNLGWDFIASGGTARVLRESGIQATEVADFTGSPEILGGRVKTLHPAIAGGLLSRDTEEDLNDLEKINAHPIDLLVCNLYPFQKVIADPDVTIAEAIENIDIGGVTLLRAAAKNFNRVTVLVDPCDYLDTLNTIKEKGEIPIGTRRLLAEKVFIHTASYDSAISGYFSGDNSLKLQYYPVQSLRYGENWHQEAVLYGIEPNQGPMGGILLQGKPLSYNNMLDLDTAWRAALSFQRLTVCIVKHVSPCGLASDDTLEDAFVKALASDPVSAFGSVIAVNGEFGVEVARSIGDMFVECIAAPAFTSEAISYFESKKNLRLLQVANMDIEPKYEYRSIVRGLLKQSLDFGDPDQSEMKCVTEREPSQAEWKSLKFAWKACQYVKSNAIVFARGEATVGIGGGQPNRVDCVHIAANRAGEKSRGSVMASDAFFPFPDSVEAAAGYGITAIIQPGGSIKDDLSIEMCNKHDIAMVHTGVRHFRH